VSTSRGRDVEQRSRFRGVTRSEQQADAERLRRKSDGDDIARTGAASEEELRRKKTEIGENMNGRPTTRKRARRIITIRSSNSRFSAFISRITF